MKPFQFPAPKSKLIINKNITKKLNKYNKNIINEISAAMFQMKKSYIQWNGCE